MTASLVPNPSPSPAASGWTDVRSRYFAGMKNPDLAAHEASFGGVKLMVIHDVNGWSCRSPVFGFRDLGRVSEGQAKHQARVLLRTELKWALEKMDGR